MATFGLAVRNPGKIVAFKSQSAFYDGSACVCGIADTNDANILTCALPSGASPTTLPLGLIYRDGTTTACTSGDIVEVVLDGIYPCRCGAAGLARGALATPDGTAGTCMAAAPVGGTNCGVLGQVLTLGVSGDMVPINLRPFIYQG